MTNKFDLQRVKAQSVNLHSVKTNCFATSTPGEGCVENLFIRTIPSH